MTPVTNKTRNSFSLNFYKYQLDNPYDTHKTFNIKTLKFVYSLKKRTPIYLERLLLDLDNDLERRPLPGECGEGDLKAIINNRVIPSEIHIYIYIPYYSYNSYITIK